MRGRDRKYRDFEDDDTLNLNRIDDVTNNTGDENLLQYLDEDTEDDNVYYDEENKSYLIDDVYYKANELPEYAELTAEGFIAIDKKKKNKYLKEQKRLERERERQRLLEQEHSEYDDINEDENNDEVITDDYITKNNLKSDKGINSIEKEELSKTVKKQSLWLTILGILTILSLGVAIYQFMELGKEQEKNQVLQRDVDSLSKEYGDLDSYKKEVNNLGKKTNIKSGELKAKEEELVKKEASLSTKEKDLKAKEKELNENIASNQQKADELSTKESNLTDLEGELSQREKELNAKESTLKNNNTTTTNNDAQNEVKIQGLEDQVKSQNEIIEGLKKELEKSYENQD